MPNPIPSYKQLLYPVLQELADNNVWLKKDLVNPIAKQLNLSQATLSETYERNPYVKVFDDRVNWAVVYLKIAQLVEYPKKSYAKITPQGMAFLNKTEEELKRYIKKKHQEHEQKRQAQVSKVRQYGDTLQQTQRIEEPSPRMLLDVEESTPLEALQQSYQALLENIYSDIIGTILSKSPEAFESIVTQLLEKMGYGDGNVTQFTQDGGIDAIIKADILGFEKIYVQAKRYQEHSTVTGSEVRDFIGALTLRNARKGVFITTSYFTKVAMEYAKNATNLQIVLIDGEQLAKYIYEYELGMQIEQSFPIKKLDNDFWDNF